MWADTVIIGGGASGLAAGISAARTGEQVLILEKESQIGKKLLATGNGRCNLINNGNPIFYGETEFASRVLGSEPVRELERFWNGLGLRLRYDREGRGYPCTFQAITVLDVLKAEIKRLPVQLRTGCRVTSVQKTGVGFAVRTEAGETISSGRIILATGGAAQPKLGGSRDGLFWLREMGHRLIPIRPALVALTTEQQELSGLTGIRIRCRIALEQEGNILHSENGEMLFTENGVSGICVMQCARFLPRQGGALIRADLSHGLFHNREELIADFKQRQKTWPHEAPTALTRGLCPGKMGYAVCKQAGIPLRGETCSDLTTEQMERLADTFMGYTLRVTGTEGFDRAQIMAGGADCALFDPETMESRICRGLYATGELLNIDGDCGGFNLMFAFASGLRAGRKGRETK